MLNFHFLFLSQGTMGIDWCFCVVIRNFSVPKHCLVPIVSLTTCISFKGTEMTKYYNFVFFMAFHIFPACIFYHLSVHDYLMRGIVH